MTLAIDFDGVIHDKAHPIPGRRMGPPMNGAKEALDKLTKRHTIVVHTVMAATPGGTKAVEDWLRFYDMPFSDVTAIKPQADVYLDDKAVRFTNWNEATEALNG